MKTPVILLVALGTLAAGCIAPPGDDAPAGARTANSGGSMTAKETHEEKVALCTSGLGLPSGAQFCAERTLRVEGDVSGISRMDVDLETFNGDVDLSDHAEGGWSLVAVLRARGASEAEAKANLDKIAFAWGHQEGDTHFLAAKAQSPREPAGGHSASLAAELPRSILLVASLGTSNGDVRVADVATDGLAAHTSNGNVEIDASVTQADLRTSNGKVDARLDPTGSGRIGASTSNGAITLELPEDARHGYDLDARTSNGKVAINLRDGETKRDAPSNPYYDPQNDARFTTRGYASRGVQSIVHLVTSNGAITVDPK